jgi:hypothetical protein
MMELNRKQQEEGGLHMGFLKMRRQSGDRVSILWAEIVRKDNPITI